MTKQEKDHYKSLIPLGVSLVMIMLVVLVLPVAVVLRGFAASEVLPQNVLISNISPNNFTVSFITAKSVVGSVSYGQDKELSLVAVDNVELKPRMTHMINVNHLTPETTYNFVIRTDSAVSGNDGKPFSITTPKVDKSAPPTPKIVTSTLPKLDTGDYSDSVVLLKSGDRFLATRPETNGNFLFTYTNFIDENGKYESIKDSVAQVIYFNRDALPQTFNMELASGKIVEDKKAESVINNGDSKTSNTAVKTETVNNNTSDKKEIPVTTTQTQDAQKTPATKEVYVPKPKPNDTYRRDPQLVVVGVNASLLDSSVLDRVQQFLGSVFNFVNFQDN